MSEKKSIYDERVEESKNIIYNAFENIFRNASLLDRFLNVVSLFDFSAQDCLLIAETMPDASHFGTFSNWQESGYRINKGEKGIAFIDYGKNTKKVWFDISQTDAPEVKKTDEPQHTYREKLRSLLSNNNFYLFSVNDPEHTTAYTHGQAVYFNSKNNCMFFDTTVPVKEIYPALATEIAHSYIWQALGDKYNREKCETIAQMASYIICKKNNIEPTPIQIPKDLRELDAEQVKTFLDNVRLIVDRIDENIKYFYENAKDQLEPLKPPPCKVTLDEDKTKFQTDKQQTKTDRHRSIRDYIKGRKNKAQKNADGYQPQHLKENTKNMGGKI